MPGARWIVTRAAPLEDYAGRIVEGGRRSPDGPGLPDVTDAATLGCLLALVREAYGDPWLYARVDPEKVLWYVVTASGAAWSKTEAEALVAALESAP
jgi:hypothetical protein